MDKLRELVGGKAVVVHAAIRTLRDKWSTSTEETATRIVEELSSVKPSEIFVPTFTYSFTESREFHQRDSPAEVGGFSEVLRRHLPPEHRTLDPVFSCVSVERPRDAFASPNTDAFGPGSLWEHLDETDGVILNVALERLISTQLHYVEQRCQVPYRFPKTFAGRVIDTTERSTEIAYRYNVRNLEEQTTWDRTAIRELLLEHGVLHIIRWNDVEITATPARQMRVALQAILRRNPRALLVGNGHNLT